MGYCSLVPRLPWNANMYRGESLVFFFLCKHDVIKIGLKQKGNNLHIVQSTMHSMLGVCDLRPPNSEILVVSCPLPSLFFLF